MQDSSFLSSISAVGRCGHIRPAALASALSTQYGSGASVLGTDGVLLFAAAAETIGVCAEPELAIKNLTPANPFFLIGSDGIFEFMPSQAVVDMVST